MMGGSTVGPRRTFAAGLLADPGGIGLPMPTGLGWTVLAVAVAGVVLVARRR